MLANRAGAGLASLKVQANEMTLDEAESFTGLDSARLFGSEKPARRFRAAAILAPSRLRAEATSSAKCTGPIARRGAHRAELAGRPYSNSAVFEAIYAAGIMPWALIEEEVAAGGH